MASPRARFIGGPIAADLAWRAFGHVIGHWVMRGYGSFIITRTGSDEALGATGPWFPEAWPEPEIGWSLWSAEAEGCGIAAEAASAARDHAFSALGWSTAVSYIDPENARSIALAERLGARRVTGAPTPRGEPCLVYRHPNPETPA